MATVTVYAYVQEETMWEVAKKLGHDYNSEAARMLHHFSEVELQLEVNFKGEVQSAKVTGHYAKDQDAAALDSIRDLMSDIWSPDKFNEIRDVLEGTGRQVDDIADIE